MKVSTAAENQFSLVLEIRQNYGKNLRFPQRERSRLIMSAEVTRTMYVNSIKSEYKMLSHKNVRLHVWFAFASSCHSLLQMKAKGRTRVKFAIHKIPIFISLFPDISKHSKFRSNSIS